MNVDNEASINNLGICSSIFVCVFVYSFLDDCKVLYLFFFSFKLCVFLFGLFEGVQSKLKWSSGNDALAPRKAFLADNRFKD